MHDRVKLIPERLLTRTTARAAAKRCKQTQTQSFIARQTRVNLVNQSCLMHIQGREHLGA